MKKSFAVIMSLFLMITMTISGTLAYLLAGTDTVVNTFTSGYDPDGDVVISKVIKHPFGDEYIVMDNENTVFDFEVTLSGYENKEVKTSEGTMLVDENGKLFIQIKHGSSFEFVDLLKDTVVSVVEQPKVGFTANYSTQEVVVETNSTHHLQFINTYVPNSVDHVNVIVEAIKNLDREWLETDTFSFKLEYKEPNSSNWVELGVKTITFDSNNPDFNQMSFTDLVKSINYSTYGTYTFRVSEIKGDIGGIEYPEEPVGYFDIYVHDADMDGAYEIQSVRKFGNEVDKVDGNFIVSLDITNKYVPVNGDTVTISIDKTLLDTSGQNKLPEGFAFGVYDEDGGLIAQSPLTSASGETNITLNFEPESAGNTYVYTIKELVGDVKGMEYDAAEYMIYVSVVDNLDGSVKAYVYPYVEENSEIPSGTTNRYNVSFVNTYDPKDANIKISGNKYLKDENGNALDFGNRKFTFVLAETDAYYALQSNPVKVTNQADGSFAFNLSFDTVGTKYFIIKEQIPEDKQGVSYDAKEYRIKVSVTDVDGELVANVTDDSGNPLDIQFTNIYRANSASVIIEGTKYFIDDEDFELDVKAGMFTFDLYDSEGKVISSVKNDEDGKFNFNKLIFDAVGTYSFIVKENSSNPMGGVIYDDTNYNVTIKVKDNHKGQLVADVTYTVNEETVDEIVYTNRYSAKATNTVIDGITSLVDIYGTPLAITDGQFILNLYVTDNSYEVSGDGKQVACDSLGDFSFGSIHYTEPGTYYYVVTQSKGDNERIQYDESIYYIQVEVKDDGSGQLKAYQTIVKSNGTTKNRIEFVNVYIPEPTDISIDLKIVKTVKNLGTEVIGPSGFNFVLYKDEVLVAEVVSDEQGFAKITIPYTEDDLGLHEYKLYEVNDARKYVTYDSHQYYINVNVELNNKNELVATITANDEVIEEFSFENIYDKDKKPLGPTDTSSRDTVYIYSVMSIVAGVMLIALLLLKKKMSKQG